jgi:hypothetical protein
VAPLLQDGTVLIFDDWYSFAGSPFLGEQRAFREWRATVPGFVFSEYHKEGHGRNSFIASAVRKWQTATRPGGGPSSSSRRAPTAG